MKNLIRLSDLIRRASNGDQEGMERLVEFAEPLVRAFLQRSTLDTEISEEVTQEVLLQMTGSLGELRATESFRPWLLRIAANKMNDYFRRRQKSGVVAFSSLEDSLLETAVTTGSKDASATAVRREMGRVIIEAMDRLGIHQRAVVSLRCFEGLSYGEISDALGCRESDARVAFFRAKRSLYRYLRRRGFSKASLSVALLMFGKLTVPAKAADSVIVSEGTLNSVGLRAILLSVCRTRTVKVAAVAAIAASIAVAFLWHGRENVFLRKDVRSVHYVVQGVWSGGGSSSSSSASGEAGGGLQTKGAYETWLYFPEGPDGPVLRREQRWNIEQTSKLCAWLQDGNANYYYHSGQKVVYITNDPLGALILPVDSAELSGFIRKMCGSSPKVLNFFHPGRGLAAQRVDNRVPNVRNFTTKYEYNSFDASVVQYSWPASIKMVDKRDAMHRRGWTYFRIQGLVGERSIKGFGRVPFVYSAYGDEPPWMRLSVGGQFEIVDTPAGAWLCDESGRPFTRFASSAFFAGLGRPWTGIRVYDSIRRDAARLGIPFEYNRKGETGKVAVRMERDYTRTRISYLINMEKDVIEEIIFAVSGGPVALEGNMGFTYLSDVERCGEEFALPEARECRQGVCGEIGMKWLALLAEGRLGELAE